MYYGLREIKKELIRVNYIVKPETQHIEKKTRKRRERNLQFICI